MYHTIYNWYQLVDQPKFKAVVSIFLYRQICSYIWEFHKIIEPVSALRFLIEIHVLYWFWGDVPSIGCIAIRWVSPSSSSSPWGEKSSSTPPSLLQAWHVCSLWVYLYLSTSNFWVSKQTGCCHCICFQKLYICKTLQTIGPRAYHRNSIMAKTSWIGFLSTQC